MDYYYNNVANGDYDIDYEGTVIDQVITTQYVLCITHYTYSSLNSVHFLRHVM